MHRFLNLAAQLSPRSILTLASVSCKQSKFQQKQNIHFERKIWMLNFEQNVSTDAEEVYAYDIIIIVYH